MRDQFHRLLERAAASGASAAELYLKRSETAVWSYSPSTGLVDGRRSDHGLALRLFRGGAIRFLAAPEGDPRWEQPLPPPPPERTDAPPAHLPAGPGTRATTPAAEPASPADRHLYLRAVEREIIRLSSGNVRLLSLELREGTFTSRILNTRGLDLEDSGSARDLVLRLTGEHDGRRISAIQVEGGRELPPPAVVAGRAVDRVLYSLRGRELPERKGEILLDPAVASSILAGLADAFVAGRRPAGWPDAAVLRDGRWASPLLSVTDDGLRPEGPAPRAHDGEGSPQRRRWVLREGALAELLTDAIQAGRLGLPSTGNAIRDSYREPPSAGPTQCAIEPDVAVSPADLLAEIRSGYYLLSTAGRGEFHLAGDRFSIPVHGVYLQKGRARYPIRPTLLAGRISELLKSVRGVGNDLTFFPRGGWYGSPTLLLVGPRLS